MRFGRFGLAGRVVGAELIEKFQTQAPVEQIERLGDALLFDMGVIG